MKYLHLFHVFCLIFLSSLLPATLHAAHGVSLGGDLKYPADFKRFDYASPEAKKGGTLTLHDLGSFDKMNPFTLKGTPPLGLGSYVFETLAVPSLDEPFAHYGLIAEDIELAPDHKSVTYTINKKAAFSDGTLVTPEDVVFSLETLKSDKAHPLYQVYFQDISGAEVLDGHRVRFNFSRVNRELHMIASEVPILSKKFYAEHAFDSSDGHDPLTIPLGTGPYRVTNVQAGKSITYTKNPHYWAEDHPTRRGMFNFQTITVKSFKDQIVSVEAFKAGEFDVMLVNIAKQWQRDLTGRHFESGKLIKKAFTHHNNRGIQGFVFNTRRPLFKDPLVRQALGLAFDFEWTNKSLFFNQYTRSNSYFSNSNFAATDLPQGAELALLEPFKKELPEEVFTQPLTPPSTFPPGSLRNNLRLAKKLLIQAGWKIENGTLTNQQGQPFVYDFLLVSPTYERIMAPYVLNLRKLGITANYRTIDPALYVDRIKNFDFDMVLTGFAQSQSPGNEQRDFWSAKAASQKGSRNLAGVSSPVVDKLVDTIIYAKTQEELTAACKALDRVLWYGYYLVPNWYLANHRMAFTSTLRYPETLPLYYSTQQFLQYWWDGTLQ